MNGKSYRLALGMAALAAAGGCINTEFGCKGYPDGARCQAVSQVLERDPAETGGYLSGGRNGGTKAAAEAAAVNGNGSGSRSRALVGQAPMELGQPIVRQPEVVRVWLAPWRDDQDRLHEASYVYLMLTGADWVYSGPTLGKTRRERDRKTFLTPPRAPAEHGAGNGGDARPSSGAGAAGIRPTPQAAGVLPPSASVSASTPATAQNPAQNPSSSPQSAGAGSVLMVPGPQGMRPVPLPQVPAELDYGP